MKMLVMMLCVALASAGTLGVPRLGEDEARAKQPGGDHKKINGLRKNIVNGIKKGTGNLMALHDDLMHLVDDLETSVLSAKELTAKHLPMPVCKLIHDQGESVWELHYDCPGEGNCDEENMVKVKHYTVAFCKPAEPIHFMSWWSHLDSKCMGTEIMVDEIREECDDDEDSDENDAKTCYLEHICHQLLDQIEETHGELPEDENNAVVSKCESDLASCMERDSRARAIKCMHDKMTEELVCWGLEDEALTECQSFLDECKNLDDYKKQHECVLDQVETACVLKDGEEFEQCKNVYSIIACHEKPKNNEDERRECRKEAKAHLDRVKEALPV